MLEVAMNNLPHVLEWSHDEANGWPVGLRIKNFLGWKKQTQPEMVAGN